MTTTIGIDCGLTGAIAVLHGDRVEVHDMPIVGGVVDGSALSDLLRAASDGQSVHVFIERGAGNATARGKINVHVR
jgi:hypothetical protein